MELSITAKRYNTRDIKRIMVAALIIVWVLVSLVFLSKFGPFKGFSAAYASNNVSDFAQGLGLSTGPATQKFVDKLSQVGLNPVVVANNKRSFFSVEGKIVALNGANVTVFEYADNRAALSDASSFQQSASTPFGSWKKAVHLYTNGNIIVFYMGGSKAVLTSLEKILGRALPV